MEFWGSFTFDNLTNLESYMGQFTFTSLHVYEWLISQKVKICNTKN